MPAVTFYLLPEAELSQQDNAAENEAKVKDADIKDADIKENTPTYLQTACELAAMQFRRGLRAYLYCESKTHAEAVDELLWQRPADAFVPHNLAGEGPPNGAPIEIIWQAPDRANRPICINLHSHYPGFAQQCRQVFDFVPAEEGLKQQARERYKHYRAAGFQLDTQPAASLNEKQDG